MQHARAIQQEPAMAQRRHGGGHSTMLFLLIAEGTAGPVVRREIGADEIIEIRDRFGRCRANLIASGVSLYRHDLVADGLIWRILNISERPLPIAPLEDLRRKSAIRSTLLEA